MSLVNEEPDEELPPFSLSRTLTWVAAGGALGTLIRAVILSATDTSHAWKATTSLTTIDLSRTHWLDRVPWSLILINSVGVFVAAWLLAGPLRHRSPDHPLRLLLVTGVLGGLTSYSSLFVDLAWIKQASLLGAALSLVGVLLVGVGAAWAGVRVSRR